MYAMAPTRPSELQRCRVRLIARPAAAAEARGQVRAVICTWDVPVDPATAALLTSELVTNAIMHEGGGAITLAISCCHGQLRVEVHDTSPSPPVREDVPADAETGRGLMLVAALSAQWGYCRTLAGKAVYFTLDFQPELAGAGRWGPQPGSRVAAVNRDPSDGSPPPLDRTATAAPRSPRHEAAQG
jgi:anti-sigma regulatory factor (Ser/Thr protein kinase)